MVGEHGACVELAGGEVADARQSGHDLRAGHRRRRAVSELTTVAGTPTRHRRVDELYAREVRSGRDMYGGADAADRERFEDTPRKTAAGLTVRALAPTPNARVDTHHTAVPETDCECYRIGDTRCRGSGDRRHALGLAIAEGAPFSRTPAADGSGRGARARSVRSQIGHDCPGHPEHGDGDGRVVQRAVTQLTVLVVAPAHHPAT